MQIIKCGMFVPQCDIPSQIAKYTLQKSLFLHFFHKKFAHIRKKQYFCTVINNKQQK